MVFIFLCALFGSFWVSYVVYVVFFIGLAIATNEKLSLRYETIYPEDFENIFQISLFSDLIGWKTTYAIVALAIILIIGLIYFFVRNIKKNLYIRIPAIILSGIFLFTFWEFNTMNSPTSKLINKNVGDWVLWDQTANYSAKSYVLGFIFNFKANPMEEPKNYSQDAVKSIVEKYSKIADEKNKDLTDEKPNIVYVMNESFSDPNHLQGLTVSEDPLAPYKQIADITYSGNVLSPQYGGGTANVEFEALTSIPLSILNPQLSIPYSSLVTKYKEFPSIVSFLKEKDYETVAVHPYSTTMYKRNSVYKTFGFDEFLSEENTTFDGKRKDQMYASDTAAYQVVLQQLEASEQPKFIHLVTMQNHMPYNNSFSDTYFDVKGSEDSSVANYAEAMYESSTALVSFIESINQLPQRTIVVFWGDHLPPLYTNDILEQNDEVTRFQTPFMIYDSKHEFKDTHSDSITSPFYFATDVMDLGQVKTSGFYELVRQMQQEIPSFKRGDYYYNDNWHTNLDELKTEGAVAYDDLQIILYDLLCGSQYSLKENFY